MKRFLPGVPWVLGAFVAAISFVALGSLFPWLPRVEIATGDARRPYLSPNGKTLLLYQPRNHEIQPTSLSIFDTETGKLRCKLGPDERCEEPRTFAPDSSRWWEVCLPYALVRSTDDGRILQTVPFRKYRHLVFALDGRLTYLDDRHGAMRDVKSDAVVVELEKGPPDVIRSESWQMGDLGFFDEGKIDPLNPDRPNWTGTQIVYQLRTGRCFGALDCGSMRPGYLTPDGRHQLYLNRVYAKGLARWKDLATGATRDIDVEGDVDAILSPDGRTVANRVQRYPWHFPLTKWLGEQRSRSSCIRLLDVKSGAQLGLVPGSQAIFSADGRTLLVCQDERRLSWAVWDYPLGGHWRLPIALCAGLASVPIFRWLRRPKQ